MAIIVQKYGGTSLGSVEKIRNVAKRIAKDRKAGNQMVVIVSAMAGETDNLVDLAFQMSKTPSEREYDVLLSTGEQVSIALLCIALNDMGFRAKSFLGFQLKIVTDSAHTKARIVSINSKPIMKALKDKNIAVVAGFQGVTPEEDITTLGRGGSDTSAVAVAASLKADVCEIYTDVEGVFTTDPNICPNARKLDTISYDEMLEMASLGAKVLHIRSVEFAKKNNIPIHVRSTFSTKPGTMVTKEVPEMEKVVVSGVAYNKNETKLSILQVPDRPGIAAKIFEPLSNADINVDMIIQNISHDGYSDMTFTVAKTDYRKAREILKQTAKKLKAKGIESDEKIAKVSIIGVGMHSHAGVASKMFSALAKVGVNIQMISTSEIKVSCVIDRDYTELAVRALHDAFELHKKSKKGGKKKK